MKFGGSLRFGWSLLKDSFGQWSKHNAPRLGAALAYYAILSLAPLLVVMVAICGFVFGEDAARGQIYWEIKDVVGPESAAFIQSLLSGAHRPAAGILASGLSFLVLLAGASGVFGELRDTLNFIWDAPIPKSTGLAHMLRYRVFCFAAVLALGFLLVASLAASAGVQALGHLASHRFQGGATWIEVFNFAATLTGTATLFALIYRFVPQVPVAWADVVPGAVFTAILFSAGKLIIGLYLGTTGVGSAYGAASSVVVLLVWVYYSSQIFLLGAEFTHVYAIRRGSPAIESAIARSGLPPGTEPPPPS